MIRGVILDLDGTVYRGGCALPGAIETITELRNGDVGVLFVSNNPTVSAETYARRLSDMGAPTNPDQVVTSGGLTVRWLTDHHPQAKVLLVSESPLRDEMIRAGISVTGDPTATDVVVVSFDRTFDYVKWRAAFDALRNGALFVATNPDKTCPTESGEIPDCAGIIAALEVSTGRQLDTVVGKPSQITSQAALERLNRQLDSAGIRPDEVMVVGDRIETDIALGVNGGFTTVLVLSGVSSREDLANADPTPTHVLEGLGDLPDLLANSGS